MDSMYIKKIVIIIIIIIIIIATIYIIYGIYTHYYTLLYGVSSKVDINIKPTQTSHVEFLIQPAAWQAWKDLSAASAKPCKA